MLVFLHVSEYGCNQKMMEWFVAVDLKIVNPQEETKYFVKIIKTGWGYSVDQVEDLGPDSDKHRNAEFEKIVLKCIAA